MIIKCRNDRCKLQGFQYNSKEKSLKELKEKECRKCSVRKCRDAFLNI